MAAWRAIRGEPHGGQVGFESLDRVEVGLVGGVKLQLPRTATALYER